VTPAADHDEVQWLNPCLSTSDQKINQLVDKLCTKILESTFLAEHVLTFRGAKTLENYQARIRSQLEVLVLNVIEKGQTKQRVIMSRMHGRYTAGNYFGKAEVTKDIIPVADALSDLGLLAIHTDERRERVTRIEATDALAELLYPDEASKKELAKSYQLSIRDRESPVNLKKPRTTLTKTKTGKQRQVTKYCRVPLREMEVEDR